MTDIPRVRGLIRFLAIWKAQLSEMVLIIGGGPFFTNSPNNFVEWKVLFESRFWREVRDVLRAFPRQSRILNFNVETTFLTSYTYPHHESLAYLQFPHLVVTVVFQNQSNHYHTAGKTANNKVFAFWSRIRCFCVLKKFKLQIYISLPQVADEMMFPFLARFE